MQTSSTKVNVSMQTSPRVWVAHLWLWVRSLADCCSWFSEVPEADALPFSPHADRGWRQVSDSRLSCFDLPLWESRSNSTTHQLLHNSVLEAYLNTMTTLPACSLIKGSQRRFKEDLSSFRRLLLKWKTRRRAFEGGVWGFVAFLVLFFASCFRPYSVAIHKHMSMIAGL